MSVPFLPVASQWDSDSDDGMNSPPAKRQCSTPCWTPSHYPSTPSTHGSCSTTPTSQIGTCTRYNSDGSQYWDSRVTLDSKTCRAGTAGVVPRSKQSFGGEPSSCVSVPKIMPGCEHWQVPYWNIVGAKRLAAGKQQKPWHTDHICAATMGECVGHKAPCTKFAGNINYIICNDISE